MIQDDLDDNKLPAFAAKATKSARQESASDDRDRPRIKLEPENVDKGLVQLVLTVTELLRQLMEKQALHRMEAGELTDAQIEKMGQTFSALEVKMQELREHFNLTEEDLNIHLGPLGDLM